MTERESRQDRWSDPRVTTRLRKRHRSERTFQCLGGLAIFFALGSLAILIGTTALSGIGAFVGTEIRLDVQLDSRDFESIDGTRQVYRDQA